MTISIISDHLIIGSNNLKISGVSKYEACDNGGVRRGYPYPTP
jgi:hypothetical protein